MYKIKVNGQYDFGIDQTGDVLTINGQPVNADAKQLNKAAWHIIHDLRSYNAEMVSYNPAEKTAEIKVNNTVYSVAAKDQFDLLLDKLGMSNMAGARVSELKAPMPGLVLKVFVEEGAEVKKGDNLFVLEAMKMENIIKSPADVSVKSVKIKPGDKVEKNQVLLQFS